VADTLARLKDALAARDEARTRLHELETRVTGGGEADTRLASNLRKQSERLSALNDRERTIRETVEREMERSRSAAADMEAALHDLEGRHSSGQVMDATYEREASLLRSQRTDAEARIAVREKALQAETAKDLDWLDSVPTVHRMAEGDQQPGAQDASSVAPSEWPGASVPERIAMLWRESKKPNSRRSIIVSSVVVGVIAVLVLGVVFISSHLNPGDPADYLGVGEFLVPVVVDDAQNLRSLEITLEYDNTVVTAVSVIQGDVGRLAVMQYDIDKSGSVDMLVRDVTGIEGTGTILIVRFKTVEIVPGPTALRLASLSAIDSRTMQDMPVQGEDGWVNTGTRDVQSPAIRFP